MLCSASKLDNVPKIDFRIVPGELIRISGCELNGSRRITDKLVKLNLDWIEGRLLFVLSGHYSLHTNKYMCAIAVAAGQCNRVGMCLTHVECWPHDPKRERRRGVSLLESQSAARRGLLP